MHIASETPTHSRTARSTPSLARQVRSIWRVPARLVLLGSLVVMQPLLAADPEPDQAQPPNSRYTLLRTLSEPADSKQAASQDRSDQLAREAVKLILKGDLSEASEKINHALRLRVDRSYYHLLNGLVYHLQARQGAGPSYELAEQGYKQSIQFDPSNWQAHFLSGLLSLDMAKFDAARNHLAEAMYLKPEDASVVNAFAYAAYRAGAADAAAGAINALEAMGGLQTAAELRNAALIMGAVGESERAQKYLARLRGMTDARSLAHVERRLQDWSDVHKSPGMVKAQFAVPMYQGGGGGGGSSMGGGGGYQSYGSQGGFGSPGGAGMPGGPGMTAPGTEHKMVVVDVVIISTEEDYSNQQGTNLLRGLQLQFGGSGNPAYSRNFSSTTGTSDPNVSTTITRSISIPSVMYSLNIFNINSARNEILARPTLVATAGRPSEFFSGAELNAVVVSSGINSNSVNITKDIGTTLQVTPFFLDDGRITLKVLAQRTFIKTPNNNLSGFDARVETSKSRVDASVVMRPGETLILGGLSEKEGEITRDGVPLLQDIPLVQYMFARRTSRDYQKSTLILITPRPAQYVYQPEKAREEYEKSLTEEERPFASLRARYADWFRPYPNWASVFRQLQENGLYREFRTGDVVLENWADMRSLKDRLAKVLDFLHF